MLLGSTANSNNASVTEPFVIQLMLQQRYAEVYELLSGQQSPQTSVLYNKALCLHWSGNYQAALSQLDSIKVTSQLNTDNKLNANNDYQGIRTKQIQMDDHLQGITEAYVKAFPVLVNDAITRLKTDCWLQLRNYPKVIALATLIAYKGYKDITDALKLADTANDKRI
jgi:hypothetical protein